MTSTGWRTEALCLLGTVLVLALLGDVAERFGLGHLGKVVVEVGSLAAPLLAVFTARIRKTALDDAKDSTVQNT